MHNYEYSLLRYWDDDSIHYFNLKINKNNQNHFVCVYVSESEFLDDNFSLENYINKNLKKLTSLPKTSELANITYEIFNIVSFNESDMCFIENQQDLVSMGYTLDDLDLLEKDIKKYGLENLIEINLETDPLITGYGELQCAFADDRFYNENTESKYFDLEIGEGII